MIIHCDSCGKAVSNRLEQCPFCMFHFFSSENIIYEQPSSLEELISAFQKRPLG